MQYAAVNLFGTATFFYHTLRSPENGFGLGQTVHKPWVASRAWRGEAPHRADSSSLVPRLPAASSLWESGTNRGRKVGYQQLSVSYRHAILELGQPASSIKGL